MPEQRPDVLGVLPGDPPLSVIAPLGADADANHILVGRPHHTSTTACSSMPSPKSAAFDDRTIQAAPAGQGAGLIAGVAERAGAIVLIADPEAMAARL